MLVLMAHNGDSVLIGGTKVTLRDARASENKTKMTKLPQSLVAEPSTKALEVFLGEFVFCLGAVIAYLPSHIRHGS